MTIAFFVSGHPKGQPRARSFAFKKAGKYTSRMYDPGTAEGWKSCVAAEAMSHRPAMPYDEPLVVMLDFYLPRPKSMCRKKDPQGPIPCTAKPDADNLAKAVMDALTQIGMWRDDAVVVELIVRKHYHAIGSRPGCEIFINTF